MIDSPAATLLASGASSFVIVDTYVIGAYTFSSDTSVIKRGTLASALGLDPATLDVTIATGGSGGPGAAFKAAALAGSLAGVPFTYTRNYAGTGGGDVLRFTGTVQRVEPSSTDVRIVAISQTVDLDSVLLPTDVICATPIRDSTSRELQREVTGGDVRQTFGTLGRGLGTHGRPQDQVSLLGWRSVSLRSADPDRLRRDVGVPDPGLRRRAVHLVQRGPGGDAVMVVPVYTVDNDTGAVSIEEKDQTCQSAVLVLCESAIDVLDILKDGVWINRGRSTTPTSRRSPSAFA